MIQKGIMSQENYGMEMFDYLTPSWKESMKLRKTPMLKFLVVSFFF